MAFSRELVENLLVAARRCCCICRRFCGPNIEIHHIIPLAEGGSDEEANGIPLCFDCHAAVHAAGSPRSRKYSFGELRRLRDEWFAASRQVVAAELQRTKSEILEYLESLSIPSIHDTLLNVTETLDALLKAKDNEEQRQAFTNRYRIGLISDPRYYARLGALELEYKNYPEAVRLLSHSLELDSEQAPVHFNLFKALLAAGKFGEAMSAYRRAVSIDEDLRILPEKYRVTEVLGRGAFATVYKAELVPAGKVVAVKLLRGEHMRDYSVAAAFSEEAKLLRELVHESLVRVYEQGSFKGRYYVAWEYVEAASLKQLIESGTLVPAEVLVIAEKLLSSVKYIHSRGVVHRDIKPSNVLVTAPEHNVKLVDFGVAMTVASITTTISAVGTLVYAAPEVMTGRIVSLYAADTYSLGVTLFEAMTGGLPGANTEVPPPSGYPSSVWAAVVRMLSADPKRRPSAAEVHALLQRPRSGFEE